MEDHKHQWIDNSRVVIKGGRPILSEEYICISCGERKGRKFDA